MKTRNSVRANRPRGGLPFWLGLPLFLLIGCGKGDSTSAPTIADPASIEGHLEVIDSDQIAGWVWNMKEPDGVVKVDIYDGTTKLTTVEAGEFRQDLLDAKKGNGRHGFLYATPASVKDGKAHTISVKVAGTSIELTNSPKTVTLRSP